MSESETELTISRLVDAPRAAVWRAWSEPENLEEWWCPRPRRAEFQQFDMRPGGALNTIMRGPEGEEQVVNGAFLEIVPQERIVFTTLLTGDWCPTEPFLPMTAIITMTDEGAGTRYSARVLHKNAEDCRKHREMGFSEGWGAVIRQLGQVARRFA